MLLDELLGDELLELVEPVVAELELEPVVPDVLGEVLLMSDELMLLAAPIMALVSVKLPAEPWRHPVSVIVRPALELL